MRMRTQLLGLAGVCLLFLPGNGCCGVGMPELMPRYSVYDGCTFYDCPIAVGSEVEVVVYAYGDEETRIQRAALADPAFSDVTLYHHNVLLHPQAAGQTRLEATLVDGNVHRADLTFADRATTRVHASLGNSAYPPGLPQVFAGSSFVVTADHRDAANQPLLGSGLEQWSVTGGTLAQVAEDDYLDTSRMRRVQAGGDPRLVVHARGDGTPLEVDVLPGGSTNKLELVLPGYIQQPIEVTLRAGSLVRVPVRPFSADGRFIYGSPTGAALTSSTDNFDVATAQPVPGELALDLYAAASGSTVMTVNFDGHVERFRINVQ